MKPSTADLLTLTALLDRWDTLTAGRAVPNHPCGTDAAARRSIDAGIGDSQAAADMQAKQGELSTIETRLCVMFVVELDRKS